MTAFADLIPRGLIVSCQAPAGSPLQGPGFMVAMARCAEIAGAGAIRADGPDDVRAIREATGLPVIGIFKRRDMDPDVYITPTIAEVAALMAAGATVVAIDATLRPRRYGTEPPELIAQIHQQHPQALIMADVASVEEGERAALAGAHAVATTLSGYTDYTPSTPGPNLDLVAALASTVRVPVVAEGRYHTPAGVSDALRRGAYAVVVGTAITNPIEITRGFVAGAMEGMQTNGNGG